MMNVKKRKKSSRFRGTHTHGRGFKKKARGSGHQGGVGNAGSGKRADQKKDLSVRRKKKGYFGKSKILRGIKKPEIKTLSLEVIDNNLLSYVKKGIAKEENGVYKLDLKKYKIIGNSSLNNKVEITALDATKGAIESVKKSSGEIIILKKTNEKKEGRKKEQS